MVDYITPQGTNIPYQGTFEDDFPFPKVGYVSFVEGNIILTKQATVNKLSFFANATAINRTLILSALNCS